jgi:hypothetical protein
VSANNNLALLCLKIPALDAYAGDANLMHNFTGFTLQSVRITHYEVAISFPSLF